MAYRIFFGLGSNLGDKEKNIEEAYRRIKSGLGKSFPNPLFM